MTAAANQVAERAIHRVRGALCKRCVKAVVKESRRLRVGDGRGQRVLRTFAAKACPETIIQDVGEWLESILGDPQ